MKFALIDGIKSEAIKGGRGICANCKSELIAKCGDFTINHWAHKGKQNCDQWWEAETEWHRNWKNNFPNEWQEYCFFDEISGEKHIADIFTIEKLVIEFQHSSINPRERDTREEFYKNMIWVVNGTRLKRDIPRFLKGKKDFTIIDKKGIYKTEFVKECFPAAWLQSKVAVIFDFLTVESIDNPTEIINYLYCLFPIQVGRFFVIAEISRKAFINKINSGEWLTNYNSFMEKLRYLEQERKIQVAKYQQERNYQNLQKFFNPITL